MSIDNKVIITGSRGIIGSILTKYLEKLEYDIIELDLTLGHDLTDEEFVKDWFSKHHANSLINLFAMNDHINPIRESNMSMDISLDLFNKYLQINIIALFSVCREFIRSNKNGIIVNFASIYGLISPNPKLYRNNEKNIAYGVSKAGVIQLTKHLAVHFAPHFRVNCIAPGGVMHDQGEEFQRMYGLLTPLGRMMDAEEICGITEFLISDKSSYCTGGVYIIDGGWTSW